MPHCTPHLDNSARGMAEEGQVVQDLCHGGSPPLGASVLQLGLLLLNWPTVQPQNTSPQECRTQFKDVSCMDAWTKFALPHNSQLASQQYGRREGLSHMQLDDLVIFCWPLQGTLRAESQSRVRSFKPTLPTIVVELIGDEAGKPQARSSLPCTWVRFRGVHWTFTYAQHGSAHCQPPHEPQLTEWHFHQPATHTMQTLEHCQGLAPGQI